MNHLTLLMGEMMTETIPEADREKFMKFNMDFFVKLKEFPKIIQQSKDNDKAEKELNEADKLISSASLEELIKKYSKAVAYAEPGSSSLARIFANRSALLTNNSMYEDSLKDIDRALEIGYPDKLKAKLYARKAKNLFSLKGMCSEVKEAIAQTKEWSKKMDEDNRKNVLKTINKLKAAKSSKEPIEDWDSSMFLREMPNKNPKILGASGSIDIQESKEYGRYIVATRDIKAGEVIMKHKFYTFFLYKEYIYRICSYCSNFTYSGIPCKQCPHFIYCNENCRDNAWNEYHDIECNLIVNILSDNTVYPDTIYGIRLLAKALKEFGTIDKLYEKIQEIDSTTDSIKKLFSGDVHDESKYASVYSLFRAESKPPFTLRAADSIVRTLFILSATTEILEKKYDDLTEIINDKWIFFVGKLLSRHMEITYTNAMKLPLFNREGDAVESFGLYLSPLKDLCSHSCDPNSYPLVLNQVDTLIAIQPIKKGDQIFINYNRIFRVMPTQERKSDLQKCHKFTCNCIACVNNWGPDTKFPSCMKKLRAKDKQNKISKAFDKFDEHVTRIHSAFAKRTLDISSNYIKKSIDDLSLLLNIIGADNYPSMELIKVKCNFIAIIHYIMTHESIKQLRGSLK